MRGRVVRNRGESGAELRDSTVEVTGLAEAASGVGGEDGGLFVGFLLGEFAAGAPFDNRAGGVAGNG